MITKLLRAPKVGGSRVPPERPYGKSARGDVGRELNGMTELLVTRTLGRRLRSVLMLNFVRENYKRFRQFVREQLCCLYNQVGLFGHQARTLRYVRQKEQR